jgi:hypothetical protein
MAVVIRRAFDILRMVVSSRTDIKLSEENDCAYVNSRQLYQRKNSRAHEPRKKKKAPRFLRGLFLDPEDGDGTFLLEVS